MKYLITGANGYIGSHLAHEILKKGHQVRALIYPGTESETLHKEGAEVVFGDIRDFQSVANAAQGCEAVYHLASYVALWAKDPNIFQEVNVAGTRNLLNVCRMLQIRRVLICSSCGIFGPSNHNALINEAKDNSDALSDPYEVSKFRQVETAKQFLGTMDIVFVYPTRVFGPGIRSDGNSLTRIFEDILDGKWKFKFGDGRRIANYVFIKDVVQGMLLAMECGKSGEGYILGGYNLTYNFLFETLQVLGGKHLKLKSIPPFLLKCIGMICEFFAWVTGRKPFITLHAAKKYTSDWLVSIEKIRALGFRPTPLPCALVLTLARRIARIPDDVFGTFSRQPGYQPICDWQSEF